MHDETSAYKNLTSIIDHSDLLLLSTTCKFVIEPLLTNSIV